MALKVKSSLAPTLLTKRMQKQIKFISKIAFTMNDDTNLVEFAEHKSELFFSGGP